MKKILLLSFFFFVKIYGQQKKDSLKVEKLETIILNNSKEDLEETNPNRLHFSNEFIENSINVLGEPNPIKLIQLSSGVQAASEGQSGFIVRGGNQSMNLFYLDNIYLHNTSHIGGLFPSLNADYIKDINFYKGGFLAEDGGRLSSITKIETKSDLKKNQFKSSIGLLSAKITTGIDIEKLNTSVLISGRRTFLELLNPIIGGGNSLLGENRDYFFYDYLFKIETRLGLKNRISITNFSSKDDYENSNNDENLSINWQNNLIGINWFYRHSSKFNNHFVISNSRFKLSNEVNNFPSSYTFRSKYQVDGIKNISTINFKEQRVAFGVEFQEIKNNPKDVTLSVLENKNRVIKNNEYLIQDLSLFVEGFWKINENLNINTGLRGTKYVLKNITPYSKFYLEPRISLNYQFKESKAFKFSFQSLRQYLHQARITTFSLPLDYFIPTNEELPFQKNIQFSTGYYFKENNFKGNLNVYYKKIKNYSEFKNGALENLFNPDLYNDVVKGSLASYGAEFHLEGHYNKFNGVLNYTYSKTEAKFKEINKGALFPTTFNRPHNFNFSINYKAGKKWNMNALFVFTSGQNYTPINDLRVVNEFLVFNFGAKNSASFPNYHRLDLGVNYIVKQKENYKSAINFTIYNVYNNQNPFYINNEIKGSIEDREFTINSSFENLFPILPAISWNLSF